MYEIWQMTWRTCLGIRPKRFLSHVFCLRLPMVLKASVLLNFMFVLSIHFHLCGVISINWCKLYSCIIPVIDRVFSLSSHVKRGPWWLTSSTPWWANAWAMCSWRPPKSCRSSSPSRWKPLEETRTTGIQFGTREMMEMLKGNAWYEVPTVDVYIYI